VDVPEEKFSRPLRPRGVRRERERPREAQGGLQPSGGLLEALRRVCKAIATLDEGKKLRHVMEARPASEALSRTVLQEVPLGIGKSRKAGV
jgi:hypothetical protein